MAARIRCNGVELAVEDSGGAGPTVLFSHGLLYSRWMWDAQVVALRQRFRCVSYDHRGQGAPVWRSITVSRMVLAYRPAERRRFGGRLLRPQAAIGQGGELGSHQSNWEARTALPLLRAAEALFDKTWRLSDVEKLD